MVSAHVGYCLYSDYAAAFVLGSVSGCPLDPFVSSRCEDDGQAEAQWAIPLYFCHR